MDFIGFSTFVARKTRKFSVIEFQGAPSSVAWEVHLSLEDAYTNAIVSAALRRRCGWVTEIGADALEDAGKGDNLKTGGVTTKVLQLCDFERIDWVPVMSGRHQAASYLVRKGLSRKAQLSLQIKRYVSKHPKSALSHAVPFTVILETWDAHEDDMKMDIGGIKTSFGSVGGMVQTSTLRERLGWCLTEARTEVQDPERSDWFWILKPSYTNKGSDIAICGDWNDVIEGLLAVPDIREWVLQRYIEQPLLIRGHKFHLRVYVLCVGALKVYVFDDILALLAAQKYDLQDIGPDAVFRHLTNTARSCEDVNFDEEKFVKRLDDLGGSARGNALVCNVRKQIHSITAELFAAFENEYTIFAPMENCFELYGLDFMVAEVDADEEEERTGVEGIQVTLLETNPGPDFKQTGDRLKGVIVRLWEGTCKIVLDGEESVENFTKVYEKDWSVKKTGGGMKFT